MSDKDLKRVEIKGDHTNDMSIKINGKDLSDLPIMKAVIVLDPNIGIPKLYLTIAAIDGVVIDIGKMDVIE